MNNNLKLKKSLFTLLIQLSFALTTFGTNYYFSNKGYDSDIGNDPVHPFKTLQRLEEVILLPGDSVFFERGSVFEGQLTMHTSGEAGNLIYFGAYGDGQLPVFTGSILLSGFSQSGAGSSIYAVPCDQQVKGLFINEKLQSIAREPDYPNHFTAQGGALGEIADQARNEAAGYWKGATVRFRPVNWVYEYRVVTSSVPGFINYDKKVRYPMKGGWGYHLDNKRELLDTPGEWFYDNQSKKLLVIPGAGITGNSISARAVVYDNGIILDSAVNYISIENLIFEKYNGSGILGVHSNQHISIRNCAFQQINEAGIRFVRKADFCVVMGNSIRDIQGRGISFTEAFNNQITNNQVRRIGLNPGYGLSGVNNAVGIVVEIRDESQDRSLDYFDIASHHNSIAKNRVDSCGYIGIRCDGQNNTTEHNIVADCMLTLADGSGIYCYSSNTFNSTIKNNFVFRSLGNLSDTPESNPIANGIYIDNNCYHMLIDSNTVVGNTSSGVVINSGAHDNYLRHGVFYGNKGCGLNFSEWQTAGTIINNEVTDNVFFSISSSAPPVLLLSNWAYNFGTYDYNTYCSAYSSTVVQKSWKQNVSYNLTNWKQTSGQDQNSISYTNIWTYPTNKSMLITNQTNMPQTINVAEKNITDLSGNLLTEIVLKPYFSKIVLFGDASLVAGINPDITDAVESFPLYQYPVIEHSGIRSTVKTFSHLMLWPNPVNGEESFFIEYNAKESSPVVILLYTSCGKLVFSQKQTVNHGNRQICVKHPQVKEGVYFVKVVSNTSISQGKIIIQ